MPGRRQQRVANRIQREVATLLAMRMEDPRLHGLSVTGVDVSPDLRQATIYVSSLSGEASSKQALAGLQHARSFLRQQMASRIELRVAPELHFRWDASAETGDRIDRLIDSLAPGDALQGDDHEPEET